jgi:hypothetical protein
MHGADGRDEQGGGGPPDQFLIMRARNPGSPLCLTASMIRRSAAEFQIRDTIPPLSPLTSSEVRLRGKKR